MRKKSLINVLDYLLWMLISLFPFIYGAFFSVQNNVTFSVAVGDFINGVTVENNTVYYLLKSMFSSTYGFYVSDFVLKLFAYFCCIQLLHLLCDLVLFIPKLFVKE